ncbi:Putative hypothetical protein [Helicobacter mustelae 12198]|uniref:Uncharacterized protein n=1 Tax=Helicobacter mustelae (strain ATCC 43772 / CCUG 25715 / CIP 103759 / LMG 18044 / NCTC 12198 / R85-136P) TaxID=679897 RepID=D3UG80_HELM1|nr:Putative hypothetical protein [Helicobacter mustelae 12198]
MTPFLFFKKLHRPMPKPHENQIFAPSCTESQNPNPHSKNLSIKYLALENSSKNRVAAHQKSKKIPISKPFKESKSV